MKKEEIIIQAYRLCEEIKTLGFEHSINLSSAVDSITIYLFKTGDEEFKPVLHVHGYFHNQYVGRMFQNVHTNEIIPALNEFINQHKKLSA